MRKIYKLLVPLIAVFALWAPFSARATHVMGADIEWSCLGNDTFLITAHAYRDCNGIQLTGTDLQYFTPGDTCVPTPVGSGQVCCGTDITPVCNRSCTRCISNSSCVFPYGIEEFTITEKVYLSPNCCHYTFSWEENARNSAITTGAANQTFYIEVHVNICVQPCVSSPYFTNPPVAIFCVNQCEVYNPGVDDNSRDAEGRADSLSYSFGVPLSGPGMTIPYQTPYTNDAPLIFAGQSKTQPFIPPYCYGFHLDSTTGDLEFKAVKTDITVLNIVVTIYRRDSLGIERVVGDVQRGLELIIIDCPNDIPPVIPGINGGNSYSEKICADKQTCFNVKAFDLLPADTVKLAWNNPGTMDGATFTVVPNGQKWPTAVFCWFPTDADVRTYPYTFIATATDNACPIPGSASKAFNVYVISAPSAIYSATVEKCGVVLFQAQPSATSSTSITSYLWVGEGAPGYGPLYIIGQKGTYKYTKGGTYHYSLIVTGPDGCVRNYSDSVKIANFPGISIPRDTEVCNNTPTITVKATPVNAFQPYQIWWNFKDKNGDSITTGTITEKITHDTAFRVNILDQGCTNYDSMKVKVIPLPQPNIGPDQRGCWGKGVMLTTGLPHMPVTNWTWILGKDTEKNVLHGDTIYVQDSGIYVVYAQDSIGCGGYDTVNVFFNPLVQANRTDSVVCINSKVTLRAGIGGSGASYLWLDAEHGNRILSTSPTFTFVANANVKGGYGKAFNATVVIRQSQHGITCVDSGYYDITVHTPTRPTLYKIPPQCISNPALFLTPGPPYVDPAHQGGTWTYPRNPSAIIDNYLYPSVMGETFGTKLGWIYYTYTDQYKCDTADSIQVIISDLPQVSAGPDTTICTAKGLYLLSNGGVTPNGGLWSLFNGSPPPPSKALTYSKARDSTFFDPNAAGVLDTVYGVIYNYTSSASGGKSSCSNSDTVFIRVRTNPQVTVIPMDSLCLNADPLSLTTYANPQNGIWNFSDGTNPSALTHGSFGYGFLASVAGPGWHHIKYTAYGDQVRSICPTSVTDSVYVVAAPSVDFHTIDNQWEYCVNHNKVSLVPTLNGGITKLGAFNVSARQDEITNTGATYFFLPGNGDTVNSNTNTVTYTLQYNKNECHVSASHVIKVDGRPSVQITTGANECAGPTSFIIKATKSNATKLVWTSDGSNLGFSPLNGDSSEVSYSPTGAQLLIGSFQVTVTASNSGDCTPASATTTFNINPLPVVNFSSDTAGCEPFAVHYTSTVSVGGVTNSSVVKAYDWDFGDGSAHSQDADPIHVYNVTNGKDTQQYNVTLTVTSDSNCVNDIVKNGWITVYATPKPIIAANPQFTTIALPQVQFNIDPRSTGIAYNDPNTTYRWTFGDSTHTISTLKSPQYTYGDTGVFKVRLEVNSNGCIGDTFIDVYVQPELIIYIPNVFKPDNHHGDIKGGHEPNYFSTEVNNTFQPYISSYQSFQMDVYNRWGQLMYSTTDPNKGWTGWFEGHEPVQDAYVYVIKATGFSGKAYTFTGTVTLLY